MKVHAVILAAAMGGPTPWLATAAGELAAAGQLAAAASGYTDGELKKIDIEQGKITIKHAPVDNLGMPGMTMVFRVDPAVLARFKVGDQVRFKADRVDGSLKVTELLGR